MVRHFHIKNNFFPNLNKCGKDFSGSNVYYTVILKIMFSSKNVPSFVLSAAKDNFIHQKAACSLKLLGTTLAVAKQQNIILV